MTTWKVDIARAGGGWSWELARDGVVVLVAAEPFTNPATCTINAEMYRRNLACGRYVLAEDGSVVSST